MPSTAALRLAIAGDLLVVGQGAYLQVAEVQIGMAAPKNIAWLALRHGEALAARLTLLGDRWDAEQLLRSGIASEVVADDQVAARACAHRRAHRRLPAAEARCASSRPCAPPALRMQAARLVRSHRRATTRWPAYAMRHPSRSSSR